MKGQPFKKVAGVLKSIAPTLLAAAGGPAGALAAGIAKSVFGNGTMSDDDLDAMVEAATTTPTGLAQLRQIEADLKKSEAENNFKFAALEVDDRKDSRALAKEKNLTPWLILTALFIGGYFSVLTFVLWGMFYGVGSGMIDPALLAIASTLLGVLTGEIPRIMSWWFGSSRGSSSKDDVLAEVLRSAAGK